MLLISSCLVLKLQDFFFPNGRKKLGVMKFNVSVLTYIEVIEVSVAKTECNLAHGLRC
jgi:hypothetical protein